MISPFSYKASMKQVQSREAMQEFETSEESGALDDNSSNHHAFREFLRYILKRMVVFVCFGPGILGVLWTIGRIFKR